MKKTKQEKDTKDNFTPVPLRHGSNAFVVNIFTGAFILWFPLAQ